MRRDGPAPPEEAAARRVDRYRFTSLWRLAGSAGDAFDVLRAIEEYPSWWPEVRAVQRVRDDRVAVLVRSILPYDLRFDMIEDEADRTSGVLRARMEGDLDGFSAWSITTTAHGATALRFDEDVRLTKPWLNRFAPVARRAFEWNHAMMMRHGERGLRAALAGYRLANAADRDGD